MMTPALRTHSATNPLEAGPELSVAVSTAQAAPLENNEFLKYLQSLNITPTIEKQDTFVLETFSHKTADYYIERVKSSGAIQSAQMSFKADQQVNTDAIQACVSSFVEPIVRLQLIAGTDSDIFKLEKAIEAFANNPKVSLKIDFNAQALSQGWAPERVEALSAAVTVLNEATSPAAAQLAINNIKKLLFPKETLDVEPELKNIRDANAKLAAAAGNIFQQASALSAEKEAKSQETTAIHEAGLAQAAYTTAQVEVSSASALIAQKDEAAQKVATLTTEQALLQAKVDSAKSAVEDAEEKRTLANPDALVTQEALSACRKEIEQIAHSISEKNSQLQAATQELASVSSQAEQYSSAISQLSAEASSLRSAISEKKDLLRNNEENLISYDAQIQIAKDRISGLEKNNHSLLTQITDVNSRLAPLQELLATAESAEAEAKTHVTDAQKQLDSFKSQLPAAELSAANSKAELAAASEDETQMRSSMHVAIAEHDTTTKEVYRLKGSVESSAELVRTLSEKVAHEQSQIDLAEKKLEALSVNITDAQATQASLTKSVSDIQQSLGAIKSALSNAETESDQAKSALESCTAQVIIAQNEFTDAFTSLNQHIDLI